MTKDSKGLGEKSSPAMQLALFIVSLAGLGYSALWSTYNGMDIAIPQYLALHTLMEVTSIVIAMLGAGVVWNAYASERPGYLVLMGQLLFGTGLLDFAHMLSVPGMPNMITPAEMQKSITFWLAARVLPAVGFCICALGFAEPLKNLHTRFWIALTIVVYVALIYWAALFHMDLVPIFYTPMHGLTPYKVDFEYCLVSMYGLAALWLFLKSRRKYQSVLCYLFMASAIAALSELCFTLYRSDGDLFNLVGHCYKIVSYTFIYMAIFASSVRQPFESLHATVTALERALVNVKKLSKQNESIVRTLDLLEEAVLVLDAEGQVISANTGWSALTGERLNPLGTPLIAYAHPDERDSLNQQLQLLLKGRKVELHERFRFSGIGQEEKWFDCRLLAGRDGNSGSILVHCVIRDITKLYLQERYINHMALHDALTGLPNRLLLEDRIRQALQRATRTGGRIAICFIDLDNFKDVNNAYGHKVGDEMILGIVHKLRNCLREGDTLARWGGDEFVAVLPDVSEVGSERNVAQKLVEATRDPIEISGAIINFSFSMGIVVFPDDEPSGNIDLLLAQADRTMFYAKAQGRNNFQLCSDVSHSGVGKRNLYIQGKLAKAIRAGQISAWFQPQVDANLILSGQTKIKGVEVLARWHDEELGWISPESFIPMAENLGLIAELSTQVRRIGFSALRQWLTIFPDLKMSVNVSKRQLFSSDIIAQLLQDVESYGLSTNSIILEITESVALADVAHGEERLRQLATAGFTLSIDDFGTGYASLSQLHDLPVGELKIDISFVRRLHTDDGCRMVQGILGISKALNLKTVAEGVEDLISAKLLGEMGVDLLQGYYFGRPCTADEFAELPFFIEK